MEFEICITSVPSFCWPLGIIQTVTFSSIFPIENIFQILFVYHYMIICLYETHFEKIFIFYILPDPIRFNYSFLFVKSKFVKSKLHKFFFLLGPTLNKLLLQISLIFSDFSVIQLNIQKRFFYCLKKLQIKIGKLVRHVVHKVKYILKYRESRSKQRDWEW